MVLQHISQLENSNGTYNDEFDESVSISGDYAIAGAGDDSENGFLYTGRLQFSKEMQV
ncbi:MAG: hypothetical protein IPJ39_22030 [Saprospiraceae bacterium]|nr:hypothetical protein [Saprospiraceae bacterium]